MQASSFSPAVTLKSEISFHMNCQPFTSVPELQVGWCLDGVIFQAAASTLLCHLAVFLSCLIVSSCLKAKAVEAVLNVVLCQWPVGDHQLVFYSSLFNVCPYFQDLRYYAMLQLHITTGDTWYWIPLQRASFLNKLITSLEGQYWGLAQLA